MIEPVVKRVRVPVTPDVAFRRFTEEVDTWWPRSKHSVSNERCRSVSWSGPAGSTLYEVDADGRRHVWGTFLVWEPPHRFAMSWHPGRGPEKAQRVDVTFESDGDDTVITLTHSGFELLGEAARASRDDYDGGWQGVLATYRDALGADLGSRTR